MGNNKEKDIIDKENEPWKNIIGTRKRIAAYLWFNINEGETFTLADVRSATNTTHQTQTDRRLRELREQNWEIEGYKNSKNLKTDSYILIKKGNRIWLGEETKHDKISEKLRRIIFKRDNNTCCICGISSGETYPDSPNKKAVLTVGHRIPNQRLGKASLENLQTECARCNEPIRNLLKDPEVFEDIRENIDQLEKESLKILSKWISDGKRTPQPVDIIYSKYATFSPDEKKNTQKYINKIINPDNEDKE